MGSVGERASQIVLAQLNGFADIAGKPRSTSASAIVGSVPPTRGSRT
jgi:hypothetical protein